MYNEVAEAQITLFNSSHVGFDFSAVGLDPGLAANPRPGIPALIPNSVSSLNEVVAYHSPLYKIRSDGAVFSHIMTSFTVVPPAVENSFVKVSILFCCVTAYLIFYQKLR